MTTKIKHSLIILITGVSFITTTAQTPAALENLFRLEGSWEGEATLIYGGNTFIFTYHADFKKNHERSGIYMEEWFSHPDLGSLKGYNLIGYNARDQKIHWFSVDNFGTCHDHFGYWKTDDHFYMETTEKNGGKKFEEKIDLIFQGEDELLLHLIATVGGQLFQDVTVIFHRQNTSGANTAGEKENTAEKKPSNFAKETMETSGCKVFPNPAKDQINFQLPSGISCQDLKLSVFNASGGKIKDDTLQSTITAVSLNGYKAGVYFYKITNKAQLQYSGRFIVQ